MSDTTPTNAATEATTERRGFSGLACIHCGLDGQGSLVLRLDDLTADESIHCDNCGSDYSIATAEQVARQWLKVAAWVRSAPAITE